MYLNVSQINLIITLYFLANSTSKIPFFYSNVLFLIKQRKYCRNTRIRAPLRESLSFCNPEGTVFFHNIQKPTNSSYKGRTMPKTITKITAEQNRIYSNKDS